VAEFFQVGFVIFLFCLFFSDICLALLRAFGVYVIVQERQCVVYQLFGNLIGEINEPGLHFLPGILGVSAFWVNFLGKVDRVDMRLDQEYVRSQAVNSEEGAPMGIGVWYEMYVSNPVDFLIKNNDPAGSLRANVANATVRSLSNQKLANMLENRHQMSRTVRAEVSPQSHEWGYRLGSVYVRKVHLRDAGMIRQIEEKVVNRLRQVTGTIRQDGANQVSLITSTAERQAAIEFARAAAVRPEIVGLALQTINADPEIGKVLFQILETQQLLASDANITLIDQGLRKDVLSQQLVAGTLLK